MYNTVVAKEPSKGLVIAAFLALYIVWGSTYLANLYAIKTIPPLIMLGSRFLIAGLILYFWCLLQGQKTPDFRSLLKIAFSGIMMLAVGTGAVVWAEQYISSGLTAIIAATVPLWFVALDRREWQKTFSNKMIVIGLVVGFIGTILLFGGKGSSGFSGNKMNLVSILVLLAGTVAWAFGSLYSKYKPVNCSTILKAALQMVIAGITALLYALLTGEQQQLIWNNITASSVTALIYLILIGSLVGYVSYIWLLSVRPASLVGTYAYVNPLVAVFLGWLFIGEKISTQQMIALCVILVGVILVNIARPPLTPPVGRT